MNILIISYNNFPDGDAGAVREYAIGKLFSKLGHTVFFIGMGKTECNDINEYKGFKYISLRINQNNPKIIKKFQNYLGHKNRLKRFIKQYSSNNKIGCILVVSMPLNSLLWIKKYANKNSIRLLHDSVEWYSPEQFKLGRFSLSYISKELTNRIIIDKNFSVIAISKYLEQHFLSRGIATVRIPVIMDVSSMSFIKKTQKDKLTILYAGSPGKKDYLKEIIEGIALLNKSEIETIDFILIGIDRDQLVDVCDVSQQVIDKLGDSLNAAGRVPRESVLKSLEKADFTILLRSPVQRYAKAGFPTKVVESLATATPVMLNLTSDLGDYITDMEQGLIIPDCSPVAIRDTTRRALNLDYDQKGTMYSKARKCAEDNFHYEKYQELIQEIMK